MILYKDISLKTYNFNWDSCSACNLRNRFLCKRIFKPNELEPLLRKKKVRIFNFENYSINCISEALSKFAINLLLKGEWDAIPLIKNGCNICICDQDNCINLKLKTRRRICFCPKLFGIDLDLTENEGALLLERRKDEI